MVPQPLNVSLGNPLLIAASGCSNRDQTSRKRDGVKLLPKLKPLSYRVSRLKVVALLLMLIQMPQSLRMKVAHSKGIDWQTYRNMLQVCGQLTKFKAVAYKD